MFLKVKIRREIIFKHLFHFLKFKILRNECIFEIIILNSYYLLNLTF